MGESRYCATCDFRSDSQVDAAIRVGREQQQRDEKARLVMACAGVFAYTQQFGARTRIPFCALGALAGTAWWLQATAHTLHGVSALTVGPLSVNYTPPRVIRSEGCPHDHWYAQPGRWGFGVN